MYTCPSCMTVLSRVRNSLGFFWQCPSCLGKAVTLESASKTIPKKIIGALIQKARFGVFPQKRKCLNCKRQMKGIPIKDKKEIICIDVCPVCRLIWFDVNDFESLSTIPINKKGEDISPRTREMLALADIAKINEIEEIKEKIRNQSRPDGLAGLICAIFDL